MIIPQPNPITVPSSFFCLTEVPNINNANGEYLIAFDLNASEIYQRIAKDIRITEAAGT